MHQETEEAKKMRKEAGQAEADMAKARRAETRAKRAA
jgi:hypothetical protein